ncbi:MAG: type II secretion system minor pseudopilin GspI [Pseudomonadales bacterium]
MNPRSRGFTLIELLIALMIFSVLGFTVTSRISEIVQQSYSLERRTAAQWVADNQVNALHIESRNQREPVAEGRRSERVLLARRDWQVDYQVVSTSDPGLKRVELEVFELLDDGTKAGPLHSAIAFVGEH